MSQKVYFAMYNTQQKLSNGEMLVAYHESELDLHKEFKYLSTLMVLCENSFYHVGYKMGNVLASMRHLLPEAKLGGAELEDLYSSYSNRIFDTHKLNLYLEVANFAGETASDKYNLVYSDGVLSNYNLDIQKRVVDNMLKTTNKYVVFGEKVSQELMEYIISLGHNITTEDDLIIVTKVVPKVVEKVEEKKALTDGKE